MRDDPPQFAIANAAPDKRPRYVVSMLFDTGSLYFTSHGDITSVPGIVLNDVLKEPSAISQRLFPDEGRSEIGSFSCSIVDLNAAVTDAFRTKLLTDSAGMRGLTVQFWCGFEGFDFTAFELFQTQIVVDAEYEEGAYTINCADLTRSQRKDIFEPKFTTLRDNVSDSATTIPVYDTTGFAMVVHGTSWSDSPSSTVGYLQVEDEKIRYTGITADSFTGCTRGVLNTKAVAHNVDAGTSADRRTKVAEEIYIELPAVKLAWAVMTGELYGSANVLPPHWHLGIDSAYLRESDFTGVGPDLWVTSDDSAALVLRFEGLRKTDGKRFLEKEIYLVLGCYSPVYSDGTLGLRRHPALLDDSAPVITLTEREVISLTPLQHDLSGMHNNLRVNWNFDNAKDDFTRITTFLDDESISINKTADLKAYSFKGLYGSRHTDSIVKQRLHAQRDAYAYPPQRISVTIPGSLSRIELGDVARLKIANLRDFAGVGAEINRAFVVLNKAHRAHLNEVSLDLFGSTARPLATPPSGEAGASLPDAFYTAVGANLNTIATITANVMATGNYTITGNASLTNAASVFYHNADLTIPSGCNLTIENNVQLRIRGFLTLNGTINGTETGKAGVSDDGTSPWDKQFPGNAGYVGTVRGYDGIEWFGGGPPTGIVAGHTLPVATTRGQNDAAPFLQLSVSGNNLAGLPDDLRGTGGGAGGRLTQEGQTGSYQVGGTGGDGGAGLAIICRGMSLGVSASITLNGGNTTNPGIASFATVTAYPGAGAPGAPGTMLILLDGNSLSVPDITGKFFGVIGSLTQAGNPMLARTQRLLASSLSDPSNANPHSGYADPGVTSAIDLSNAAHRIQYVPTSQTPGIDVSTKPPAPTALVAGHVFGGNAVTWTNPDLDTFDMIEVYASIDNNRVNSVKVGETRASSFLHSLPLGGLRYYWAHSKINAVKGRPALFSEWEPLSATAGESSNIETPGEVPDAPDDITGTGMVNAIRFQWSLPAYAKLAGELEIYEGATTDDFEDVEASVPVWVGYGLSAIVSKDDDDDHRYWLVLNRSGIRSDPSPIGGIVAAAASVTAALVAYATPTSVSRTATLGPNPRTAITPPTDVTASGGTGPYTYAWTWLSGGSGITIDFPTFNDTTFTATHNLDGTILTGTARCTVTDDVSATAIADVAVLISFPSIG